jgi:hypothetical protein
MTENERRFRVVTKKKSSWLDEPIEYEDEFLEEDAYGHGEYRERRSIFINGWVYHADDIIAMLKEKGKNEVSEEELKRILFEKGKLRTKPPRNENLEWAEQEDEFESGRSRRKKTFKDLF